MSQSDERKDFEDFITALDAMNELAQSFWDQDEPVRACLTEAQIYESSKKILGEEHPGTLNAMHNYALGLAKTGHDKEAADILNSYLETADRIERRKEEKKEFVRTVSNGIADK